MKPKEKKCKGTGKAKGFGCGEMIPQVHYGKANRIYGIGISCGCYPKWLYNTDEGRKQIERISIKVTKDRKDLEKAEKEHKNRKGLGVLLSNVRDVCHEYIRKRDKGKPCISCGTPWNNEFEAGHLYPTKYSTIRYYEYNIHGQCIQCNRFKDGNFDSYLLRLPERIGAKEVEHLLRLAEEDKRMDLKWDREHLKEIRNNYRKKIKELK